MPLCNTPGHHKILSILYLEVAGLENRGHACVAGPPVLVGWAFSLGGHSRFRSGGTHDSSVSAAVAHGRQELGVSGCGACSPILPATEVLPLWRRELQLSPPSQVVLFSKIHCRVEVLKQRKIQKYQAIALNHSGMTNKKFLWGGLMLDCKNKRKQHENTL